MTRRLLVPATLVLPLAALLACTGGEPPPPPEPEPAKCDLSMDTLDGRSFVRQDAGKEDLWARARFQKAGDVLKLRYNSRSPFDMYDYTCKKGAKGMECLADKPDLQQWCQTLIANKGSCSPADLAELTGASVEDAKKAYEELQAKMKKLKPDEIEKMKRSFSAPSNQLRGVFNFKLNTKDCVVNASDLYQTMTDGKLRELETFVGNSRFVETDKELVFEHCKDVSKLVALETPDATPAPGVSKVNWPAGSSIKFKVTSPDMAKPEPGCTYTMDTFDGFALVDKGVAVAPGADGKLEWTFDRKYDAAGRQFVDFYRYKACGGGEPQLVDRVCAMVKIE